MTAKEMAHWERWHRRGRQQFQCTQAALWFVVQGFGGTLITLALDMNLSPVYWLGTGLIFATMAWFSSGNIWDQREADYRQQLHAGASASTRNRQT